MSERRRRAQAGARHLVATYLGYRNPIISSGEEYRECQVRSTVAMIRRGQEGAMARGLRVLVEGGIDQVDSRFASGKPVL